MTTPTPEELIAERVEQIRTRLANATKGTWEMEEIPETGECGVFAATSVWRPEERLMVCGYAHFDDALLLSNVPEDLNWALTLIESLSAQVAQLQGERAAAGDGNLAATYENWCREYGFYSGAIEPLIVFRAGYLAALGAATQPENEGEVRDELAKHIHHIAMTVGYHDYPMTREQWADAILAKFAVTRRPALSEGETPQPSDSGATTGEHHG